jgi:hypothetical protein
MYSGLTVAAHEDFSLQFAHSRASHASKSDFHRIENKRRMIPASPTARRGSNATLMRPYGMSRIIAGDISRIACDVSKAGHLIPGGANQSTVM